MLYILIYQPMSLNVNGVSYVVRNKITNKYAVSCVKNDIVVKTDQKKLIDDVIKDIAGKNNVSDYEVVHTQEIADIALVKQIILKEFKKNIWKVIDEVTWFKFSGYQFELLKIELQAAHIQVKFKKQIKCVYCGQVFETKKLLENGYQYVENHIRGDLKDLEKILKKPASSDYIRNAKSKIVAFMKLYYSACESFIYNALTCSSKLNCEDIKMKIMSEEDKKKHIESDKYKKIKQEYEEICQKNVDTHAMKKVLENPVY